MVAEAARAIVTWRSLLIAKHSPAMFVMAAVL